MIKQGMQEMLCPPPQEIQNPENNDSPQNASLG